jgi:tetratricopeptide (TPR) repeat protein
MPKTLAAGLLVALAFVGRPALADDDSTTTAAARERFNEGLTYFDQKQYEKARAAFLQAYALKKHPAVLLNLAQSELRSGHERDAAEHFAEYLREATDESSARREAAQAGLASAKTSIAEITLATEPDADVSVDGTLQGLAPLPGPLYLEPGTHTLQAKKGDRTATQNLTAKAGESREIKLKLSTEAAPVVAAKPAPATTSEPENRAATEPAPEGTPAPRAEHGREPFFHWLLTKPAGVVSGGATILLTGGAIGFAIASSASYSNADDTAQKINDRAKQDGIPTKGICVDPYGILGPGDANQAEAARFAAACKQHQDDVKQGDTFKTVATVAGIGAGVMAVTTGVLYFVTADTEAETGSARARPGVVMLPWFGSQGGGLSVAGRF